MPKLIFVTVGTSAIDNCQSAFPSKGNNQTPVEAVSAYLLRQPVKAQDELLNSAPGDTADQKKSLVYNLKRGSEAFEKSIGTGNMINQSRNVSAEVASLLVMSKEPDIGEFGEDDEIHLIPSETDVGIVCAKANRLALQSRFPHAQIECTRALEGVRFVGESGTEKEIIDKFLDVGLERFEQIIKTKKEEFVERFKDDEKNQYILDVTGGFKGLILFAPILCARYLKRLYYFYQEAKRPVAFTSFDFRSRFEDEKKPIARTSKPLPPIGDNP